MRLLGANKMKIIYKASNILEAHIVAGMLNAHDIETHVGGHFLQGAIGDLSAFDFATIFVAEQDIEQAALIIHAYENNAVNESIDAVSGMDRSADLRLT